MTVHFEGIGRDKKSWSVKMNSISGRSLEREIRKQKALMSSGIDFLLNEDGTGGDVLVGGFRNVGAFRIEGGAVLTVEL